MKSTAMPTRLHSSSVHWEPSEDPERALRTGLRSLWKLVAWRVGGFVFLMGVAILPLLELQHNEYHPIGCYALPAFVGLATVLLLLHLVSQLRRRSRDWRRCVLRGDGVVLRLVPRPGELVVVADAGAFWVSQSALQSGFLPIYDATSFIAGFRERMEGAWEFGFGASASEDEYHSPPSVRKWWPIAREQIPIVLEAMRAWRRYAHRNSVGKPYFWVKWNDATPEYLREDPEWTHPSGPLCQSG
jgi:hypothetical protein